MAKIWQFHVALVVELGATDGSLVGLRREVKFAGDGAHNDDGM